MRCLRCGVCCKETEMLLSEKDIERLERKGYRRDFFVRFDPEGYPILRNHNGYCVFYDAEKRGCKVRGNRPLGCKIYPVIYDEERGILIDYICPRYRSINEKQKARRGKKVLKVLKTIDAEAEKRRNARNKSDSIE